MKKLALVLALLAIVSCTPEQIHELQQAEGTHQTEETMERLKLDGVLQGELKEQATPDRSLRTVGLVLMKGGQRTKVADQTINFGTNTSGNPRVDLVQWNGQALSVKAGTAAASPDCPAPDSGNIPIAVVVLPNSYSSILNLEGNYSGTAGVICAIYYAVRGLYAAILGNGANQDISGSNVAINGLRLPLYLPRAIAMSVNVQAVLLNTSDTNRAVLDLKHALDGTADSVMHSTADLTAITGGGFWATLSHWRTVPVVASGARVFTGVGNAQAATTRVTVYRRICVQELR